MACGTGKTFTSLCIAEQIVPDGGNILFVAPSIALVSQSRREWLQHTKRPLGSIVVCSDKSAGGRNEGDLMPVSELICEVTTNPTLIAQKLKNDNKTKVVFSTYQSLESVIESQISHQAPPFDLIICDEAHRTTGVGKKELRDDRSGFQKIHDNSLLSGKKRIYMTATPRIYKQSSKKSLKSKGYSVIDMSDEKIYGPILHHLTFKDAVKNKLLSDYRVIVAGVHQNAVSPGLKRQLIKPVEIDNDQTKSKKPPIITYEDLQRIIATSLAINGLVEGDKIEAPKQLYRSIVFANSIVKSKYYAKALDNPFLKSFITKRKGDRRALKTEIQHLDSSHNSYKRFQALDGLRRAADDDMARVLCNVGLFSEGVDVPSLDAVIFMEPRSSQIDVVQAIGRAMRLADGKKLGYVIVPIPIKPGNTLVESLQSDETGYDIIGRVLRALQAHDERLTEEMARFVEILEVGSKNPTRSDSTIEMELDIQKRGNRGIWQLAVLSCSLCVWSWQARATGHRQYRTPS